MVTEQKPLGITEVVLRDAHQSLFATRLHIEDMLPIAGKLDRIGFWSLETWGGATFDACIRYLGEDPWERMRRLKSAMPNTRQQMLLRGQNLLGYRHYADDVVEKFVERAAANGVDVFRIFDAMNDVRNLETAVKAVLKQDGAHAQGTLSYTVSPVHTLDMWIDMAKAIEDLGVHSVVIKDMAGLLKPYAAYELVSSLKNTLAVPIHMHCHATTGLSMATALKAVEAGVDNIDTAISSMSMTYGHSPTEAVVAMLEESERCTGLDISKLEEIAAYFRTVRKKYKKFEGTLMGVDSRILVAQVPGGMLTNLENQLKEQKADDKLDEILEEIPRVRKDLGYIPLVTPTSQIVGTQAVLNVLTGERYKTISKETAALLRGEYGAAPASYNRELQERVLEGAEPMTCRPADKLESELENLTQELKRNAAELSFKLAAEEVEDVLTFALFSQVGLKFLQNRGNPEAFEPTPTESAESDGTESEGVYTVTVKGNSYTVHVAEGGEVSSIVSVGKSASSKEIALASVPTPPLAAVIGGEPLHAPLTGSVISVIVKPGQVVQDNTVVIIMEAMKMETEICAHRSGTVAHVYVKEGETVNVGDPLLTIA